MSIPTEIGLLIANMIIFSRLGASFPVKGAKNVKHLKKCQLTEYIDIALSDLVFLHAVRLAGESLHWEMEGLRYATKARSITSNYLLENNY